MPILQFRGEPERAGEARRADSASKIKWKEYLKSVMMSAPSLLQEARDFLDINIPLNGDLPLLLQHQ